MGPSRISKYQAMQDNNGSLSIGLSFSYAWETQGCWDFNADFSHIRLKCQTLTVDKGGRFRGDMRLWETRTLVLGTGKQRQGKKDDSRSFNSVVDNPVIIKDGLLRNESNWNVNTLKRKSLVTLGWGLWEFEIQLSHGLSVSKVQ